MNHFKAAMVVLALLLMLPSSGLAQQPVTLAFATLDTGSAWYVYGATMAELFRKALPAGSNIDVKPRSGGVGNPRLVAKNETPLGFAFTVTNRWAYEGKEAYDAKHENLRALVGGLDTYYLVAVASKKLPIASIKEIKDKKVPIKMFTQPVGSLGEFAGRQLLRSSGVSYADIKSWGGSTQHVGYNAATMPADTFKGQSEPVKTVGFPTVLITNKELPDAIAYTVTKAVVDNKDALVRGHAGLVEFDPTKAWQPERVGIPLHPGAERVYREKGWMK